MHPGTAAPVTTHCQSQQDIPFGLGPDACLVHDGHSEAQAATQAFRGQHAGRDRGCADTQQRGFGAAGIMRGSMGLLGG